jgi:hypothetical protein
MAQCKIKLSPSILFYLCCFCERHEGEFTMQILINLNSHETREAQTEQKYMTGQ